MHDSEELLRATAGVAGDKAHEVRERLSAALEAAKRSCHRIEEKAIEGAKATDRVIREHPYESIGVAFGVGLLLAPLIVSYLFRKTSYENTVSALAAIILAPVVIAALATYPRSEAAFEFASAVALLREPAVLVAGLSLFCYAAMDVSFSNWLPAFGKEAIFASDPAADPDAADASAQRLISVYAVSLICGRLVASQVPALTEYGSWFVAAASLATALVIAWMTMTRRVPVAWTLVFVAGLASAPFFPTIVGITFVKYPLEVRGSVFGIIFAWALLGGAIVPKAIGNLARGSSVQRSMRLLVPLCLLLVVLALILGSL